MNKNKMVQPDTRKEWHLKDVTRDTEVHYQSYSLLDRAVGSNSH